jgi:(E)-4-hydroxy-3-methylbut-2-enyl-diphosphate synthase
MAGEVCEEQGRKGINKNMASSAFSSRIVQIGDVPLGGGHPIRIQSMTTTNTLDTLATVEQSVRMIEAGCEYVRITAPGVKEAENLRMIKKELRKRGYTTPLIADIHYQPNAALLAARYVEKVRINPGNYVDRKRGRLDYSEAEYRAETERIRERLKPLVEVCRQYGTALRIGSNHGSLSERILLKYGDTPEGMVESALEFVRICEDLGFHIMGLSMKASNVKVMVQANRLLVKRMLENDMDYPMHLGVTEAGDAEDGRIKSAAGIGPLLMDGIGDTIRVSLTEEPELEIPAAKEIIAAVKDNSKLGRMLLNGENSVDPFSYNRRKSLEIAGTGGSTSPRVVVSMKAGQAPDTDFKPGFLPDLIDKAPGGPGDVLIERSTNKAVDILVIPSEERLREKIHNLPQGSILVFNPGKATTAAGLRQWFDVLKDHQVKNPVILRRAFDPLPPEKLLIKASIEFATLLVDGLPDGIWLAEGGLPQHQIAELSFGILQATGERISKTEYIACPSCGRTLFNIQSTLQVIKQRTSHLKGLKIGVMGCCVNGPGEMADAHYGYVGAGKGKITLYKGKQIMKTGIREEEAVEELVRLIKENGDWK